MNFIKKINNTGAVTLIFVMLMALLITVMLTATQSRLILSLRRSQSASDVLLASYEAESEANDVMAKLVGGYLPTADMNETKVVGDTSFEITGEDQGETQIINVTATRDFAVGKVEAVRKIQSIKKVNDVEIILSLDCTGSMDAGANCDFCNDKPTRFDSQEEAAIDFIDKISDLEDKDKFKLGVSVFGIDAKWLTYGGIDVTPESGFSFDEIKSAIEGGFSTTRINSPACSGVMDATSIGSAYSFSHNYFAGTKAEDKKQIEIVISDGVPNSRVPEAGCDPNAFCPAFPISPDGGTNYCENNEYSWSCYQYDKYKDGPYDSDNFNEKAFNICKPLGENFLRCSIAASDTFVPELGKEGIRDPEVDAYAVTIFSNPPGNVVSIFRNFATPNGYFNASRANQLKNILNTILNEILKERSTIIVRRVIPIP